MEFKLPRLRITKGIRKRLIGYPLFFAALYLLSCLALAYEYIHPPHHAQATRSGLRDVVIPTAGGPDPAWSTPNLASGRPRGRVVFVLAHGYGGSRSTWSGVIEKLEQKGYEAVAPCMPAHDASPDPTVGFGFKEADVLVRTVEWARRQYPSGRPPRVILMGVSLGGSACWLASERIPDEVDAVITEGAFARFDRIADGWFDHVLPGGHTLFHPVIWMASVMGGIDPSAVRPVDAAAKWRKPALVMQAGSDERIPGVNAVELSAAARCPLWVVPGALHARCFVEDPQGYMSRVLAVAATCDTRR